MEKEVYTEAKMEVISFQVIDIIAASNGTEAPPVTRPTGSGGGVVLPDDEW